MECFLKHIKLIKNLLPIVLVGILLCSCTVDLFAGQRPADYPNSKWICEDPRIILSVDDNCKTICEIRDDNETKEYDVGFSFGTGITFEIKGSTSSSGFVLEGDCEFGSDKMIVHVYKRYDKIFNGKYETLVFVKQ